MKTAHKYKLLPEARLAVVYLSRHGIQAVILDESPDHLTNQNVEQ